jgi:hypothetical protein
MSVPIGAPLLGKICWDAPFLGPLREGKNFFIGGKFYKEFERYVKKRPCKRTALSIGALLGNLEGFIFWDF